MNERAAFLTLTVLLTGSTARAERGDVWGFARTPAESFRLDTPPDGTTLKLEWERALPREVYYGITQPESASPLIWGDRLLVGTNRAPGVHVFERWSGRLLEVWPTAGTVEATPTWDAASRCFFVTDVEGNAYRLDAEGKQLWRYTSDEPIRTSAVVTGGQVFFQSFTGQVTALDAETGAWQWSYGRQLPEKPSILGASGVTIKDGVVYAGFADGFVAAVRAPDGGVLWERQLLEKARWLDIDSTPTLAGQCLLVAAYEGPAMCLAPQSGAILWEQPVGSLGRPLIWRDMAIFTGAGSKMTAVSITDGATRWTWEAPRNPTWTVDRQVINPAVLWQGHVLISTSRGRLHLLEPGTGALVWTWAPWQDTMGFASAPTVTDESVYLLSAGGTLYHLTTAAYVPPPTPSQGEGWQAGPKILSAGGQSVAEPPTAQPEGQPIDCGQSRLTDISLLSSAFERCPDLTPAETGPTLF